jgi:Family of unknown function (DUF6069)
MMRRSSSGGNVAHTATGGEQRHGVGVADPEVCMAGSYAPRGTLRARVGVDGARLWGGGLATALVAALAALAGVLVLQGVLDIKIIRPVLLIDVAGSIAADYAVTAFVLALLATGLAHALALTTPRPRMFFFWIVSVATVCAAAIPFALDTKTASQVATATLNVILGACIASLVGAVLSRTVYLRADTELR